MSDSLLERELVKARRRVQQQQLAVDGALAIIQAKTSLPSLVKIAQSRLPKLRENLALNIKCVTELEKALEVSVQTDIETAAPPKDLKRSR